MDRFTEERPRPPNDSLFTPVFDVVVKQLGNTAANVYGVVWRHCQMHDHVCRASMRTLARALGYNETTVLRHVKALVQHGYLDDLTPRRRYAPHAYRVVQRGFEDGEGGENAFWRKQDTGTARDR